MVKRARRDGTMAYQVRWREGSKQRSVVAVDEPAAQRIRRIVEATGTWREDMAPPTVPSVREQAEHWLRVGTRANAATLEDYRRALERHVLPVFGDLAVTAITPELVTVWARGLPVADKTRHNVMALLSGVLASAVPEWIPTNPVSRAKVPRMDPPKQRRPLSPADFGLILAEIPDHYRPLVATLALTGLRWGEAAALTVGDVTVHDGRCGFHVVKAVKHRARQGDPPGRPKTDRSVRTVWGPPDLTPAILPLLERPADAWLFTAPRGGRIMQSTFYQLVWSKALDRAQARGLGFRPRVHDLRAAATTWMIESGLPADVVADQLGHATMAMTLDVYRRVDPDRSRRAADAMGVVLRQAVASGDS